MSECIIFIGPPGSGKSTFYKNSELYETHVRLNMDMLNSRPREEAIIKTLVKFQTKFVVDNTCINKKARSRFFEMLKDCKPTYTFVAYRFDVSKEVCLESNKERIRRIPDVAIHTAFKNLEEPELSEGFSKIRIYKRNQYGFYIAKEETI